jgi:pimeloyl-ACP methyl ester carboxylesterase
MDLGTDIGNDAESEIVTWNGYNLSSFDLNGRQCTLVAPHSPAVGNPWIWRTEFFGAFPIADIALLGKGLHVAYIDMTNMYGAPVAMPYMDEFYYHLTTNLGLSQKTVLEGFSRGGLFAFNWAARNPEKVACIYVDAPVCDFKSWPGGHRAFVEDWEICKQVYGLTEEQAMAYTGNPVDNLEPLAKAGISILSVCGADDDIVPMEENTGVVEKRYLELGGDITVIAKPLCNHHPHSLEDPAPIVDFVLQHV